MRIMNKTASRAHSRDRRQLEMDYITKRFNTKQAGDEDANGSGKLTGTWYAFVKIREGCAEAGLTGFPSKMQLRSPRTTGSQNLLLNLCVHWRRH